MDKNFDDGGDIRKAMGDCYCNSEKFSCGDGASQIKCNQRNALSGELDYWTCAGSPRTCTLNAPANGMAPMCNATAANTGCCLSNSACKTKFVQVPRPSMLTSYLCLLFVQPPLASIDRRRHLSLGSQAAESNLLACGILGFYVFVFLLFALCASCSIWRNGGYKLEEAEDAATRREQRSDSDALRPEGSTRV